MKSIQLEEIYPDGIVQFTIEQIKPEDRVNFKLYALSSNDASYGILKDYAEQLEDILVSVDGISAVDIDAIPEEEIQISIDYERMSVLGIGLESGC